jgi:hypothetical protein
MRSSAEQMGLSCGGAPLTEEQAERLLSAIGASSAPVEVKLLPSSQDVSLRHLFTDETPSGTPSSSQQQS